MAYKIRFKESVEKDLKQIDQSQVQRILNKIDKQLINDPTPGLPLAGQFKGMYKYRVGSYRVIYSTSKDTVLILRICHRKDVYKKSIFKQI